MNLVHVSPQRMRLVVRSPEKRETLEPALRRRQRNRRKVSRHLLVLPGCYEYYVEACLAQARQLLMCDPGILRMVNRCEMDGASRSLKMGV